MWATSRRDGVQTPQHLRTCECALNVFFLIFHICARDSGPEAAVDILAKKAEVDVTVWSHRQYSGQMDDTIREHEHMLFFVSSLEDLANADVRWMVVLPPMKPQNCCLA